jgi:hypothetical protein
VYQFSNVASGLELTARRKNQNASDNKSKIKRILRFFLLRDGMLKVFGLNLEELENTIFNITSIARPKLRRNKIFEGSVSHEYGKRVFGS